MMWVKPNGDLIVSDVKAASKKVFDWEDTWSKTNSPKPTNGS